MSFFINDASMIVIELAVNLKDVRSYSLYSWWILVKELLSSQTISILFIMILKQNDKLQIQTELVTVKAAQLNVQSFNQLNVSWTKKKENISNAGIVANWFANRLFHFDCVKCVWQFTFEILHGKIRIELDTQNLICTDIDVWVLLHMKRNIFKRKSKQEHQTNCKKK